MAPGTAPGPGRRDRPAHGRGHPHARRRSPEQGLRPGHARRPPRRRRGRARCGRRCRRTRARRRALLRRTARRARASRTARTSRTSSTSRRFMLEPGQSLLGLREGVEPEWWLTSEDGRTIRPTTRARLLRRLRAGGGGGGGRGPRAASQGRLPPGAARSGLAERALDLRHLRARQRDPARGAGAHVGACRHRQPHRREPFAVPLATRTTSRRSSRRRSPWSSRKRGRRMTWTNWVGNQSFAAARGDPARARTRSSRTSACDRGGTGIRAAGAGHSFTPVVATRARCSTRPACAASRTSTPRAAA